MRSMVPTATWFSVRMGRADGPDGHPQGRRENSPGKTTMIGEAEQGKRDRNPAVNPTRRGRRTVHRTVHEKTGHDRPKMSPKGKLHLTRRRRAAIRAYKPPSTLILQPSAIITQVLNGIEFLSRFKHRTLAGTTQFDPLPSRLAGQNLGPTTATDRTRLILSHRPGPDHFHCNSCSSPNDPACHS